VTSHHNKHKIKNKKPIKNKKTKTPKKSLQTQIHKIKTKKYIYALR
jgi:hypothetical protein